MHWNQSDEDVKKEIRETVEAIKKVTEDLLAKGPEACYQFLVNAGIIEE